MIKFRLYCVWLINWNREMKLFFFLSVQSTKTKAVYWFYDRYQSYLNFLLIMSLQRSGISVLSSNFKNIFMKTAPVELSFIKSDEAGAVWRHC